MFNSDKTKPVKVFYYLKYEIQNSLCEFTVKSDIIKFTGKMCYLVSITRV